MSQIDPALLEGISPERLAGIFQLFQSGQFQIPTIPSLAALPALQPQIQAPPKAQAVPVPTQSTSSATIQVMDVDKEDGEVSDMDIEQQSGLLRAPPTGPKADRNKRRGEGAQLSRQSSYSHQRPQAELLVNNRQGGDEPDPQAFQQRSKRARSPESHTETPDSRKRRDRHLPPSQQEPTLLEKRAQCKDFVSEVFKAGYTFDQLAATIPEHVQHLRALYVEMGLPVPQADRTQTTNGPPTIPQSRPPVEEAKASIVKHSTPAKLAGPASRNDYLARLQAAKSKKLETTTTASTGPPAQQAHTTVDGVGVLPNAGLPPAFLEIRANPPTATSNTPSSSRPSTADNDKSKILKDKNELLRERLAAMKIKQNTQGSAAASSDQAASSSPRPQAQQDHQAVTSSLSAEKIRQVDIAMAVTTKMVKEQNASAAAAMTDPTSKPALPTQRAPPLAQLASSIGEKGFMPIEAQNEPLPPLRPNFSAPVMPPAPSRLVGGLPGLFMAGNQLPPTPMPPVQQHASKIEPSAAATQSNAPAKQAVVSNLSMTESNSAKAVPKPTRQAQSAALVDVPRQPRPLASASTFLSGTVSRKLNNPYGQSRSESENESFIIQVSSDEDSEYEEATVQGRPTELLPTVRPRPDVQRQTTSSMYGTPGNTLAAEQLRRKEEEIKKTMKMIAEMERKSKPKALSGATSLPAPQLSTVETIAPNTTTTNGVDVASNGVAAALDVPVASMQAVSLEYQADPVMADEYLDMEDLYGADEILPAQSTASKHASTLADQAETVEVDMDEDMEDLYESNVAPTPPTVLEREVGLLVTRASSSNVAAPSVDDSAKQFSTLRQEDEVSSMAQISGSPAAALAQTEAMFRNQQLRGGIAESAEPAQPARPASQNGGYRAEAQAGIVMDAEVLRNDGISEDGEIGSSTKLSDGMELEVQDEDESDDASLSSASMVVSGAFQSERVSANIRKSVEEDFEDNLDQVPEPSTLTEEETEGYSRSFSNPSRDVTEWSDPNRSTLRAEVVQSPHREDFTKDVGEVLIPYGVLTNRIQQRVPDESVNAINDIDPALAGELQPNETQQITVKDGVQPQQFRTDPTDYEQVQTARASLGTRFTPYKSPLMLFKGYKNHPQYLQNVIGGFKSLTFSNTIDPNQPVCPSEIVHGRCNDPGCVYQHFGAMQLSDADLLKELGTNKILTRNPEDSKRWNDGMKNLVSELRKQNKGKDLETVSGAIQKFRREFVGDDSKVLNLGL